MKSFATLTQMTVFARIAESGSLSAAARDLNLSPSAVSKSLAQLEERLGVLLVKRTTRSLTLTEGGRLFLERATSILSDVENTLDTARQFGHPHGNLKLSSSIAFGTKQLPDIVGRYLEAYPEVNADIILDDRYVNLSEENFDVALRITADTHWGYAARKLACIRWLYCASPEYLANHADIDHPQDLTHHACLVYPAMTLDGAWTFRRDEHTQHIKVTPRLTSNSSLALRESTLEHRGIACLPTYLVAADISKGHLRVVVPKYRAAIVHTLYAMYYRSKYENPLIRSFIDFLANEFGDTPPWERDALAASGSPYTKEHPRELYSLASA